jgi:hypothetical protein
MGPSGRRWTRSWASGAAKEGVAELLAAGVGRSLARFAAGTYPYQSRVVAAPDQRRVDTYSLQI